MNTYNVKCPFCGTMNHNLNLEETNGWMECEHCQRAVQVPFSKESVLPGITFSQAKTCLATAN